MKTPIIPNVSSRPGRCAVLRMTVLTQLIPVFFVFAQVTWAADVCPADGDTVTDGDRIDCVRDINSTNDLELRLNGVDISTTGDDLDDPVRVENVGTGDTIIDIRGTSSAKTLSSTGAFSGGVHIINSGAGLTDVDISNLDITTAGNPDLDAAGIQSISAVHVERQFHRTVQGDEGPFILDLNVSNSMLTAGGIGVPASLRNL